MPTGTGKTEVALVAMVQTRTGALIVAPVRDLMYQWHRRILRGLGYDAGIIGNNKYAPRPVCVTTYDSAYIHMADIGERFGLLVFDEEHHLPGPCRGEAAILSTASLRIGLSATPQRSDGLHVDLDWLIGLVAYNMPFSAARGKTLANYDVVDSRRAVRLRTVHLRPVQPGGTTLHCPAARGTTSLQMARPLRGNRCGPRGATCHEGLSSQGGD